MGDWGFGKKKYFISKHMCADAYFSSLSSNRKRNYKHVENTSQQTGQNDEESLPYNDIAKYIQERLVSKTYEYN